MFDSQINHGHAHVSVKVTKIIIIPTSNFISCHLPCTLAQSLNGCMHTWSHVYSYLLKCITCAHAFIRQLVEKMDNRDEMDYSELLPSRGQCSRQTAARTFNQTLGEIHYTT